MNIVTFIVSSKFHNLLLLEGKWFTSYYLTRHVDLFIQQSPEQTETYSAVFGNFRQCGTVFYQVRYGVVRCIHLVIPNKTTNNFRFEDHSEARTRLDNLKKIQFSITWISSSQMHMHVINPLFLENWSRSHNFSVVKKLFKNATLQILNFNSVSWIIELSPYSVMLILSLFPLQ